MEGQNLLSNGVETLYNIKEKIIELEQSKQKCIELEELEDHSEKELETKQKEIQDEISDTIKRRKESISNTYDSQLDTTKLKIKKIKGKKEKQKGNKVSERIDIETAELLEENSNLKMEIKTLFKQNRVPKFCNTRLYYGLFSPYTMSDLWIILITLFLVYFVIPCGVYYYLIPEKQTMYLVIIYFITIVVSGGLYFLINNFTKSAHRDSILQGKEFKKNIKSNLRKIKKIKRSIIKDKDESHYGLENFDTEMEDLEQELANIAAQKKEALADFENSTSAIIEQEIRGHYENDLQTLNSKLRQATENNNLYENKVKEMSMMIAKDYEAFMGAEFLTIDKLNSLIELMESRNIATISEVLGIYKLEN